MRNVYRITYLSGITDDHDIGPLRARKCVRVDTRVIERVVECIRLNFGFRGELGEWVAPSALLSVEMIGTE